MAIQQYLESPGKIGNDTVDLELHALPHILFFVDRIGKDLQTPLVGFFHKTPVEGPEPKINGLDMGILENASDAKLAIVVQPQPGQMPGHEFVVLKIGIQLMDFFYHFRFKTLEDDPSPRLVSLHQVDHFRLDSRIEAPQAFLYLDQH